MQKNNSKNKFILAFALIAIAVTSIGLISLRRSTMTIELQTVNLSMSQEGDNSTVANDTSNSTTNSTTGRGKVIDLVPIFKDFIHDLGVVFISLIIFNFGWQLYHHPYMYVQDPKKYKEINVGRWFHDEWDQDMRLYRIYLKTNDGIRVVYSEEDFFALNKYKISEWLLFFWSYPDLLLLKHRVPPEVFIYEKDINRRRLSRWLYRIFAVFPGRKIILKLYNNFAEDKKKRLTEVDFLQIRPLMERLEYRWGVRYATKEPGPNSEKMVFKRHAREELPYHEYETLKKSKDMLGLCLSNVTVKTEKYGSIKEAINGERTVSELRSLYSYKELIYERKIDTLSKENMHLQEQIDAMDIEFSKRLTAGLGKFHATQDLENQTALNLSAAAMGKAAWGGDEARAIQNAILEGSKEQQQTRLEKAKLEAENKLLREMLDRKFRPAPPTSDLLTKQEEKAKEAAESD